MTRALHTFRMMLMAAFVALAVASFVGQARSASALAGDACEDAGCNGGTLNCFKPVSGPMCYGHIEAN